MCSKYEMYKYSLKNSVRIESIKKTPIAQKESNIEPNDERNREKSTNIEHYSLFFRTIDFLALISPSLPPLFNPLRRDFSILLYVISPKASLAHTHYIRHSCLLMS